MRFIVASILMFGLVGCAGGTSRTFNVGFDQAEPKLRKLYPPILVTEPGNRSLLNISTSQHAAFFGEWVKVRRDELFETPKVRIIIQEGGKVLYRSTEIVLTEGSRSDECRVNVTATEPDSRRGKAFESAILDDIEAALK